MRQLVLALALAASASAAPAQVQPPRADPAPPVRRTALTVSPFSLLLGAFAGDVERALSPTTTVGLGVTYENRSSLFFSGDEPGDYDLDGSMKLRYYPSGNALDGFALTALVGGTVYRRHPPEVPPDDGVILDEPSDRDGNLAFTFGFSFDYTRLLGADRRLVLGTGIGVKRRVVRDRNTFDDLTSVRPTLRAVVGYAF